MNVARISYFAFVLSTLLFIAFIGGYAISYFGVIKGGFIDNAMLAARSLSTQLLAYSDPYQSSRWTRLRDQEAGVVKHVTASAFVGYTLYTASNSTEAMLIDMAGNKVWQWHLPFSSAWPNPSHLNVTARDGNIFWRKAVAYPNGDLLAIYDGWGTTPTGHGLAKLDKDSRLIWKYSESVHHDVQIAEDGNIYTLINGFEMDMAPGAMNLAPPMLVDSVVILDQDGQELNRINVLDAIAESNYRWLLSAAPPNELGDYFHTNSVQPINSEIAAAFEFAEAGHILISLRELSAIVLLDPVSKKAVWGMRGPWIGQHDAEMLANGNILIFDNRGDISGINGSSRILEFDPINHEIKWEYSGTDGIPFYSIIRGAKQRLPNGNTLVTDSLKGRLFEVNENGHLVWDYRNPVRGGENNRYVPAVMWGHRYDPAKLEFLN